MQLMFQALERSRRRRTRKPNPKYFSEEFTSYFSEKKDVLGDSYEEVVMDQEVLTEEVVMEEVDYTQGIHLVDR